MSAALESSTVLLQVSCSQDFSGLHADMTAAGLSVALQLPMAGCLTSAVSDPQDRTSRSSGVGSMASSLDGGRRSSTADGSGLDMLSLTEWPGVPPAAVLLPPGQCRSLWRQFVSDSNFIVQQVFLRRNRSHVPHAEFMRCASASAWCALVDQVESMLH